MPAFDPLTRNNVHVLGPPDAGRTIVFVHGFGTDQSAWHEVAGAFTADSRVVLLDNVGMGDTPGDAFAQHRYLNLEQYATDLVDVCSALGLRGVILVGHSMGGMICALAAVKRPEIASKLVLVGASPRYIDEPGYHGGLTSQDVNGIYGEISSAYHTWVDGQAPVFMGNAERPELAQRFAGSLKAIAPDRALTILCAVLQSDHRPHLPVIGQPTLILQTRADAFVPMGVAEYMQRSIPHSRLQVIDAEGHLPHLSAPQQVTAAIRAFV